MKGTSMLICSNVLHSCCNTTTGSLAVEGFDPEEIGIEVILVSKEADFFVEQHIQNPPKSALGKSH